MKKTIWLSYDLGVTGDYEGLYSWLDDHGAKECGSSVAFIKGYEYEGDLMATLETQLREVATLDRRSRIYVIRARDDGGIGGRYIFGKRRGAPWEGHGNGDVVYEHV